MSEVEILMATITIPSLSTLLMIVIIGLIGYVESGSLTGGAMAAVMAFVACSVCLIGLIPIGGPFIYTLMIWPWLQNILIAMQPSIHIPTTLFVIFICTALLSIVLCVIASAVVFAALIR